MKTVSKALLARKILRRIPPVMANRLIQANSSIFGDKMFAHHGIQRSGTNYLNECLWLCGRLSLNSFDESRSSPKHKHFRWYNEKSCIPDFLIEQYGNSASVRSVCELNERAGYPIKTVHIVIRKEKIDWLASIMNWGLFCGWFPEKNVALRHLDDVSKDYDCYYGFWENMEKAFPDMVCVLDFDSLSKDFSILSKALRNWGWILRDPREFTSHNPVLASE